MLVRDTTTAEASSAPVKAPQWFAAQVSDAPSAPVKAPQWFAAQVSLYVKGFGAAAVQNMAAMKNFAKK